MYEKAYILSSTTYGCAIDIYLKCYAYMKSVIDDSLATCDKFIDTH